MDFDNTEHSGMPELIHRHAKPTSLDEAPNGTLCKVINGKDVEVYIQSSKIDTTWHLISAFTLQ